MQLVIQIVIYACSLLVTLPRATGAALPYRLHPTNPIRLELSPSRNNTIARTKPFFFIESLNLAPNNTLSIDMNEWRVLKTSKMFSNLTVQSVLLSPTDVQLHIKGVELPSIVVTPEVSTSTSLTKPEISGAVSFLDRNFLGLGESIQFIISKRETTNTQVNELPPSIRFNWGTNKFGRKHSIQIGYEEDHSIEDYDSISLDRSSRQSKNKNSPVGGTETLTSKQYVKFNLNSTKKKSIKTSGELQPYQLRLYNRISDTRVYGARSALSIASYLRGWSLGGWYDGGVASNNIDTQLVPYHHFGVDAQFPSHKFSLQSISPTLTAIKNQICNFFPVLNKDPSTATPVAAATPITMQIQSRVSYQHSLGEGCLPLYHQTLTNSNSIIRGQIPDSGHVNEYVSCKIDGFVDGGIISKSIIKPGIFFDKGVYRLVSVPNELRQQSCVGVSARYGGFRGDVSWTLCYNNEERTLGVLGRPKLSLGADIV